MALAESDVKRKVDAERKQMDQHDGATGGELSHETLPDANQRKQGSQQMDTGQGSGASASGTSAEERKMSLETHREEEGARRRPIELQEQDGGEKRVREEGAGE